MRAKKTRAPSGHPCGESHYRAKLPDETIRAMRAEFAEKCDLGLSGKLGAKYGYGYFASKYGCPIFTARDILTYRTRSNA